MKFTLLIIDDEKNIREGLGANFEMEGYNVKLAENGQQGLEFISKGDIDLVITDLRMPGISGEEVLRKVTTETPGIPVIVLTGHGSIDSAVDAMRNGAYDFLTKPLNLDQLTMIVKRALQARELSLQHKQLKKEVEKDMAFDKMIGKSAEMQKVFEMIKKVASSNDFLTSEDALLAKINNYFYNIASKYSHSLEFNRYLPQESVESLTSELNKLKENKPVSREEIETEVRAELEKEYEVKTYKAEKMAELKNDILVPELVMGTTKEEIDASIQSALTRSAEIKKSLGIDGEKKPQKRTPKSPANPSVSGIQDKNISMEYLASLDVASPEYAEVRKQLGLK